MNRAIHAPPVAARTESRVRFGKRRSSDGVRGGSTSSPARDRRFIAPTTSQSEASRKLTLRRRLFVAPRCKIEAPALKQGLRSSISYEQSARRRALSRGAFLVPPRP